MEDRKIKRQWSRRCTGETRSGSAFVFRCMKSRKRRTRVRVLNVCPMGDVRAHHDTVSATNHPQSNNILNHYERYGALCDNNPEVQNALRNYVALFVLGIPTYARPRPPVDMPIKLQPICQQLELDTFRYCFSGLARKKNNPVWLPETSRKYSRTSVKDTTIKDR